MFVDRFSFLHISDQAVLERSNVLRMVSERSDVEQLVSKKSRSGVHQLVSKLFVYQVDMMLYFTASGIRAYVMLYTFLTALTSGHFRLKRSLKIYGTKC